MSLEQLYTPSTAKNLNSWADPPKNVCLLENVFLCLYIHALFTLVAEIGTLQKPLPVSQIDKNLLLFRSPDLLLHPDISESNNGVW